LVRVRSWVTVSCWIGQVGERIVAGVVVEAILANETAEVPDGVVVDGARVGWGDVEVAIWSAGR